MFENSSNNNIPVRKGGAQVTMLTETLPPCHDAFFGITHQARSRPSPSAAAVVSAMQRLTAWSTRQNPWENRISARRTDGSRPSDVGWLSAICPGFDVVLRGVRCLGGAIFFWGGGNELVGLMLKRGWQLSSSTSIAFCGWKSITKPFQVQKWIKMGCHVMYMEAVCEAYGIHFWYDSFRRCTVSLEYYLYQFNDI